MMFQVYARKPKDATKIECETMVRLVVEGGAVTEERVRDGIPRAEALVFCATGATVVGVAALKVPKPDYRTGLAGPGKAGVPLEEGRYPLELGYVAVDLEWRRRCIGPFLCSQVVFLAGDRGLFATTGNDAMRAHVLPKLAFVDHGKSWQGKNEPLYLMVRAPLRY
jgi:GNAT superfamily N-acetyltransferase